MNNRLFSLFALFIALAATFTSCKKDDPAKPATMVELTLSVDNKTAPWYFRKGYTARPIRPVLWMVTHSM